MQSKILKLIAIISVFIIVSVFPVKVFSSWVDDADNFLESAGNSITVDKDQLTSASDEIYNTLTSIGMIVAVIVGMILGITYMMTGAVDKAKVKESIMPYLLGCIVILKIGIVLVFIVMFVFTNIYAFSINDLNGEGSTTGNLKATGNKTITILSVIGSLISVIVLIVLVIKYMLGSTEEKAEYKKSMLPYVIGAVSVFASSAIAGAIYNIIPK